MTFKFLQAFNGDSILISYEWDRRNINILIDGGTSATYQRKGKKGKTEYGQLKEVIDLIRLKGETINLLILTHVDDDHIGGILKWFENDTNSCTFIEQVWFNSGRVISQYFKKVECIDNLLRFSSNDTAHTSIRQGIIFEDYIEEKKIWNKRVIKALDKISFQGVHFTFLSPNLDKLKLLLGKWEKEDLGYLYTTKKENDYSLSLRQHIETDEYKEDTSIHNGSSIAFILTFCEKNFVFLADAHPSVIVDSLSKLGYSKVNSLKAEFVKIAHHGSKANNSTEMLECIQSSNYMISTNGEKHSHPDKKLLARLAAANCNSTVYFNYPELIRQIFLNEDYIDFPGFKAITLANNEYTF